ncbi:MAG TPA: prolyl oligopeptidase family serine peptidase [Vicinamibacterales bacterium]|nr:prolyl oligopeptidase family serine peptidase [Vicinamibacterales bacterium]
MFPTRALIFTTTMAAALTIAASAQTKAPATSADFGKWETLVAFPRGGLSPDGHWIAYGINRSNRNNEIRFARIADGTTRTAAFGSNVAFSADSQWAAFAIGYSESQEEKLRKDKKPIQRKLGVVHLEDGETTTVDAIESFAFDAAGTHLAMKRYAPERKDQKDQPAPDDEEPAGATLVVRDLKTGRDTTFGNVSEFAWQDKGRLLAFAIAAEDKTGNGVQLFDPSNGSLRALDSSAAIYSGLSWRKEADDLAVLRSKDDERRDGPTHIAIGWRGLNDPAARLVTFDPASSGGVPAGMRTVGYRRPSWSDDGRIVFLGIGTWNEKPPDAKKKGTDGEDGNATEEAAAVDVWHPHDIDVMPRQKLNARGDRQRNILSAWHLDSNRLVPLGTEPLERITPIRHTKLAYAVNWTAYAMDRSIGRPAADLYLVDLETGTRTKVKDRIEDQYLQAGPAGRYLLFLSGDQYWTVDTTTRTIVNVGKNAVGGFIDRESDATIRQKPPFGVAGWTKNDESVLIYDRFDIWQVPSAGGDAIRLTDGAAEQLRHRYARLNPDEEWIDATKPLTLSLFGLWSKKSGYARLDPASKQVTRLILDDRMIDRLGRAKEADVYAYVAQSFQDSPDAFVAGPDLKNAKQVTATNAFQSDYAWGREEVIEYKTDKGARLQGALFYPAGYEPGKKYPMVVYMYERLSDGVHRYSSPSERDPYNPSVFTSLGYVFLQPDIVFRPREPGLSVAECVSAAVKRAIAMGVADPARVGIVGHSWGGFDTVFLATHTDLFAAAVAGAPITDLVSNYGNHHWSSGIAETDHIETGQQRMEVPLWEDLQAYVRNSAVFGVQTMKTPLMVAFGDNDGTVHWHQGVELYNVARRAKKDVVLVVYAGEDHGLRKKANQLDYHRRIVEWFGHYLKNETAAPWITDGVSFLQREQELKRTKTKAGS